MLTKSEILQEYTKCLSDIAYYGEKYCETYDQTQKKNVPLKVFPKQKELLYHYKKYINSIVLKPRQAGISTVTALYCAHKILFAPKTSPQKILIVANKLSTANEFLKKLRGYIDSAPEWLGLEYGETNNKSEFELTNKSGAKATATSQDAMRGYTPTILIMDEAAFIEKGDEVWTSAAASLSTGGGAILISTPNGQDSLYYKTYQAALLKKNNFTVFEMRWWQDPRFNKDLVLYKGEEIIVPKKLSNGEWDIDHIKELIKNEYLPTSAWYRKMCREYNGDMVKISQELDCSFVGSGNNFIEDKYINLAALSVEPPKYTTCFDNEGWVWEDYDDRYQYILACDVSRGDGEDFSSIVIWNMDTKEQAFEWIGRVPPDILGKMVYEWGMTYHAYTFVDVTGGLGLTTVIVLVEMRYPYLHYSDASKNAVLKVQMSKYKKSNDLIPGFYIGSTNRTPMLDCMSVAIRDGGIIIKSSRIILQLRTFIWLNGRPDHQRGEHDDLLIPLAMILYGYQHYYQNVKKYNAQTLAMLNAMAVVGTTRPNFGSSPVDGNQIADSIWLFT